METRYPKRLFSSLPLSRNVVIDFFASIITLHSAPRIESCIIKDINICGKSRSSGWDGESVKIKPLGFMKDLSQFLFGKPLFRGWRPTTAYTYHHHRHHFHFHSIPSFLRKHDSSPHHPSPRRRRQPESPAASQTGGGGGGLQQPRDSSSSTLTHSPSHQDRQGDAISAFSKSPTKRENISFRRRSQKKVLNLSKLISSFAELRHPHKRAYKFY